MPHANASFPRSGVLVLGSNSIQSLVPSTLISQAEALLESHRIEDAIDLADQQRKKIHSSISVDEDQVSAAFVKHAIPFTFYRPRNYDMSINV